MSEERVELKNGRPGNCQTPLTFEEWVAGMPPEFQEALERYLNEVAGQLWLQRGGGVSSSEQQLADLLEAKKSLFETYAPK